MPDTITLIIGGVLFFIGVMFLLLIGAVIYQYFKNKTVEGSKLKPPTPKETWTGWKKLVRSILVIGLWAGVNYLGWKGLFPEFWEEWYAIGKEFFWTSHTAIISIFLVNIWLRDEENKNKRIVNGIVYALIMLLIVSSTVKITAIADEKGWWPEEVAKVAKKRTSKAVVVKRPVVMVLPQGSISPDYLANKLTDWKVSRGCVMIQLSDRKNYTKCRTTPDRNVSISPKTMISFRVLGTGAEMLLTFK